MKIVVVSGGFDPIHSGHVLLCNSAKTYGDYLIVGVNSDEWLSRKKGKPFMKCSERAAIISNLKSVDEVILFDDSDGSACDLLEQVKNKYPGHQIIFANGGDRTKENIPEMSVKGISFIFGVGGENKTNSSSWILNEWAYPKTYRSWGWYRVLDNQTVYKVKELVIQPGQTLSMQRHFKRSEHWYVLKGRCNIETIYNGDKMSLTLHDNESYFIGKEVWHRGFNVSSEPCHVLEVQYGEICVEEDIERM
jgi:D-beta-D-heptose 7-phosphate kinase/D-beta-D-heptose 1-phosphate adenosyltransferase